MKKLKNISGLNDNKLILLYKKKFDKEILGELYIRYTEFVFLVSIKYLKNVDDSKDSVMQIFEKIFEDLKKHDVSNFKSWLYTVTRNHCLMKLRKEQLKRKKYTEYKKDSEIVMESDDDLHQRETGLDRRTVLLNKAIEELKPKQKECINLFYLKEKTYAEIVKITGYTFNNVKSYIQNGKRNLRIKLLKVGIKY